jgi:hypothetical protein
MLHWKPERNFLRTYRERKQYFSSEGLGRSCRRPNYLADDPWSDYGIVRSDGRCRCWKNKKIKKQYLKNINYSNYIK